MSKLAIALFVAKHNNLPVVRRLAMDIISGEYRFNF